VCDRGGEDSLPEPGKMGARIGADIEVGDGPADNRVDKWCSHRVQEHRDQMTSGLGCRTGWGVQNETKGLCGTNWVTQKKRILKWFNAFKLAPTKETRGPASKEGEDGLFRYEGIRQITEMPALLEKRAYRKADKPT